MSVPTGGTKPGGWRNNEKAGYWGCGIFAGLVAFMLIGQMFGLGVKPADDTETKPRTESERALDEYAKAPILEPGDIARIGEGTGGVFMATDLESGKEYSKFTDANDDTGVQNLLRAGRLYMVHSGTRAKVLEREHWELLNTIVRVRILDGDMAGQEGWVRDIYLKSAPG